MTARGMKQIIVKHSGALLVAFGMLASVAFGAGAASLTHQSAAAHEATPAHVQAQAGIEPVDPELLALFEARVIRPNARYFEATLERLGCR